MQTAKIITLVPPSRLSKAQQRFLTVLQCEENRSKSVREICKFAGYAGTRSWYYALQEESFVRAVEDLGIVIKRHYRTSHLETKLATNIEEELAKDIWDMRRLKSDYPKHRPPAAYEVDFTWIMNHQLREQIKRYFRCQLPKWEAYTFCVAIRALESVLTLLPPDVHMGTIERSHIEALLPEMAQVSEYQASRGLWELKSIAEYMAKSPSWTGPRPPRFLVWKEDIPSLPETLPRPIPPDVLDQLDLLLEQAAQAIQHNQSFARLSPTLWDAILILRYTGMRAEDLCHLKASDEHGRGGCLDQDSDGYWWIRIHYQHNKMKRDHRIPTKLTDGVVDALHRQRERTKHLPDHFGEHYLFRTETGILSRGTIDAALRRLASLLRHEDQPYAISPHQFRHSVATDMIEQGVDIYTVKEFLGHKSLAMTEKYIKVYLKSLKAKYDAYRVKKRQTYASEMIANQVQITQQEGEADGGWVEGRVGKLYLSPLPDGAGNCAHLPMHDPCPDVPHCPTCPKLRASTRHLPMWENKVKNLQLTVEALRANPLYERARQKHEQELRHAEKVVETIKREGFWDGRIHNSQTNTH